MKSLILIAVKLILEIVPDIWNGEKVSFRQHSSFASSTSMLLQARGLCVSYYLLYWGSFLFRHPSLGLLSRRHWSRFHFQCSRSKRPHYQAEACSPPMQFPVSSLMIKALSWMLSIISQKKQQIRAGSSIFKSCSAPHKLHIDNSILSSLNSGVVSNKPPLLTSWYTAEYDKDNA